MGLFKRKVGGSPLGNTFRGILKKVSGGILGNGLLMKKAPEATNINSAEVIPQAQTKLQTVLTKGADSMISELQTSEETKSINTQKSSIVEIKTKILAFIQANKALSYGIALALAVVAYMYYRKKSTKRR